MLANSSPEDRPILDTQKFNGEEPPVPLLPRSAWNSNLAFLRAVFKAKKGLDEIEFTEAKK